MCVVSGVLGALIAGALNGRPPVRTARAHADEAAAGPLVPLRTGILPSRRGRLFSAPRGPAAGNELAGLTAEERVNVAVYEAANRSVVNINTKSVHPDGFFFFDIETEGSGSGSVLDTRGHILTNLHVVADAQEIQVTLYDGKSYAAQMVGKDPINDIAVLRIEAPPESLYPVTLGSSARLRVGQRVYAIGNPFGLERTLTTGIVSSVNRSLPGKNHRMLKSMIQIDAAINPGNSGGPLLDTHGRLIGMNMAIASRTGQNSGVGFAIPVDTIARVVPQLIEKGHVVRPDAGILAVYQSDKGLRVARLAPGGPAERAGLRGPRVVRRRRGPFLYESVDHSVADWIVSVDGQPVRTVDELLSQIEKHQPGEQVVLGVVRNGREVPIAIRLEESQD